MKAPRKPATPFTREKGTVSNRLKTLHRKAGRPGSLKSFVNNSQDSEVQELAPQWTHNKTANFSNPPLGIGNTRKKKNRQGQKKADPKPAA